MSGSQAVHQEGNELQGMSLQQPRIKVDINDVLALYKQQIAELINEKIILQSQIQALLKENAELKAKQGKE